MGAVSLLSKGATSQKRFENTGLTHHFTKNNAGAYYRFLTNSFDTTQMQKYFFAQTNEI